jgi:Flp pilus assembly protein TadD
MRKAVRPWMCLMLWGALAAAPRAQDVDDKYKTADTNNAVIQGRVTLPSGFAAERYFRITLKTAQSILFTTYTNKSGEFQLRNLSEGIYYVQAEEAGFEPVVQRVELGRGLTADLTLELHERKAPDIIRTGARVVSAAELAQAVPEAAKREYGQGLKAVGKGDFLRAAGHFEQAIQIYPEYLAARNDLGAQYLKLKRLDEAEKHFLVVLERDPKNFNAKFNLGLVRVERRDYADAVSQLRQAMAIDGTRAVARLWLGFALLQTGDPAGAEAELTKALVMGGDDCVAANYHLARIYLGRGDAQEAARSARSYLEEAPKGEYAAEARQLLKQIEDETKARPKP